MRLQSATASDKVNKRQQIMEGKFAPGVPLTSGLHPNPVIGQRIIRGTLVIILLAMSLVALSLSIWPIVMLKQRTARIVPSTDTQTGGLEHDEPKIEEVRLFAVVYTATAESWHTSSVSKVVEQLRPWSAPTLRALLESQYQALEEKYRAFKMRRWIFPETCVVQQSGKGYYMAGVKFQTYEEYLDQSSNNFNNNTKRQQDGADKIAFLQIIQDIKTSENMYGLSVVEYSVGTTNDWLKAGLPKFW